LDENREKHEEAVILLKEELVKLKEESRDLIG
jgi:hypothetical protein